MSLYHFHAGLIRRGNGQSAVAAAAYRAGEKLYSEYYGEQADYTKKGGVRYTEIFLPPQAPKEYLDRETLWNAVEKAEEHPKAQLAFSYDIALQNELTLEENIALARKYVIEQFVSRGMVVDFAVHAPDKECPNPHIHLLCPIRPILEDGQWGEKHRRVYELDQQGNKKRNAKGKYVCHTVSTTGWGNKDTLIRWREEWANYVNRVFEEKGLDCRIDHRSNKDRRLDELPTVHEGPAVRAMEARGIRTEKGDLNRRIRSLNASLREIRKKIKSILEWIAGIRQKLEKPKQPDLAQLLNAYYQKRSAGAWSSAGKLSNLKKWSEVINILTERNISTVDDLRAYAEKVGDRASELNAVVRGNKERISELQELLRMVEIYKEYRPVYNQMNAFKFKGRREKFKAEHEKELHFYYMAARRLKPYFTPDGKLPLSAWRKEVTRLEVETDSVSAQHKEVHGELKKLTDIRVVVEDMLHQWEKGRDQIRDTHCGTER